jgi:hypothetical protein
MYATVAAIVCRRAGVGCAGDRGLGLSQGSSPIKGHAQAGKRLSGWARYASTAWACMVGMITRARQKDKVATGTDGRKGNVYGKCDISPIVRLHHLLAGLIAGGGDGERDH